MWETFQPITRQQFSETSLKMIMVWVILSLQIIRNLLQVTKIYGCGLCSSLAVHIWLMSMAETTLFSKSHWFVMWYWKILNRIKVYKLQNVVSKPLICFSSVKMSPRAKHSMYTKLLVKESKLRPFNFLFFWQESRLTFSCLLVLAKKKEKGNFTAQLLMVFLFCFY